MSHPPDAVVVYDALHITYLRNWTVTTLGGVLTITGRVLNGGHLPWVGDIVEIEELHIPGRGALSRVYACVDIYNEGSEILLRVSVNVGAPG